MTTTKPPTILEQMERNWAAEEAIRAGYRTAMSDDDEPGLGIHEDVGEPMDWSPVLGKFVPTRW